MAHVSLPAHLPGVLFIRKTTNALDEDAGYLVHLSRQYAQLQYEFTFGDAHALTDASAPICRIRCPQRVPSGFHGNFVSHSTLSKRSKRSKL